MNRIITNAIVSQKFGLITIKTGEENGSVGFISQQEIYFNPIILEKKGKFTCFFDNSSDFRVNCDDEYIKADFQNKNFSAQKLCKEFRIELEPNSEIRLSGMYSKYSQSKNLDKLHFQEWEMFDT